MKKLLAILLALGLVLVSVAAMADGEVDVIPIPDPELADASNVEPTAATPTVTKKYTVPAGLTFSEELEFEVKAKPETASIPMITIGTNNKYTFAAETDATDNIPINFPTYTAAGVYEYTITEKAGSVQGTTTYASDKVINVKVYVTYKLDNDGKIVLVDGKPVLEPTANVWIGDTEKTEQKTDTITNVFEVGKLTVSKTTAGNLADPDQDFTIEVTFTKTAGKTVKTPISYTLADGTNGTVAANSLDSAAQTVELTLKNGQSVEFTNIPVGVTYAVKETGINDIADDDTATQIAKANDKTYYAITYGGTGTNTNEDKATDGTTGVISTTASTATVTNTKEIEVPTGIALDFVPYVMIIALAGIALVALKARKKEN